ncbi:uncharacterized protein LOC122850178 isoform X2 [Aphidius gifuensis]|uniref:uncharacterized protein LOC122850178 isoform X2 n=1 Tax=Aphidius gifuensis TaxID=684658 RepID=UPI001CDB5D6A|nr:uncharacterized protein LOC122850178 isoform X2 [Aphidius gifuensis]
MPDSDAVYQPTTVGYTYEHGGDGGDVNGAARIRSGFSRIIYRNKVSTRKWLEWVLLSVALCATVAGLATTLVNLLTSGSGPVVAPGNQDDKDDSTESKIEDTSRGSLAIGCSITLIGIVIGAAWIWLRFFRNDGKSQRGGMGRVSGQYGPVLTEVPSQMTTTTKQTNNDTHVIPMSDQEEETHTLMQDPGSLTTPSINGNKSTATSQITA